MRAYRHPLVNPFISAVGARRALLNGSPFKYNGHVPTTSLEKVAVAVTSAFVALSDPKRGDMVAALGETTGVAALRTMKSRMESDVVGRRILSEQPIVTDETVCIHVLASMPPTSFGGLYGAFMRGHGFCPNGRPKVHFVDDPSLAYVMRRYREVHDFWHVLNGVPTTVEGEIALKCVEWAQTGLPMTALSVLLGPLKLNSGEKRRLVETFLPWAVRNAASADFMLNVYYEEHFDEPIERLRSKLGIIPAPFDDWVAPNERTG
jgi:ubiquinone biosynthesis protein COQ4